MSKPENGEKGSIGEVIRVRPDGTYDIQFEDGEIHFGVDPEEAGLEIVKITKGDKQ